MAYFTESSFSAIAVAAPEDREDCVPKWGRSFMQSVEVSRIGRARARGRAGREERRDLSLALGVNRRSGLTVGCEKDSKYARWRRYSKVFGSREAKSGA